MEIIVIPKDELRKFIHDELKTVLKTINQENAKGQPEKLYTINALSKKLGMSWATINKYIDEGKLKAVEGRKIPESSVREFMQNQ